jgi:hypothetical protein
MESETNTKRKGVGMSCRDLQATIGISGSSRQFRRYVKAGLIPSKWVKKNANGHFTFHPPANTKWGALRQRIEQWRSLRFQRGWKVRPRANGKINPKGKARAIVTIQGISMKLSLWCRKMWPEIQEMDEASLLKIHELLEDAAFISSWIEEKYGGLAEVMRRKEKAKRERGLI